MTDVFEMLWDCSSCGTKGLLGKSHRHCPHCGAPQDQTQRYFPPEGTDFRVTAAYVYEGVDRVCPSCTTPNGGAADFCKNCGTPLGEVAGSVREKAGVIGVGAVEAVVAAPPNKRLTRVVALVVAAVVVIAIVAMVSMLWKKGVQVRVVDHTWQRTIDVEQLSPQRDSAWCDQMPGDAFGVSRSREQRSSNKIADGETCSTHRESRGDGSYVNKETCTPNYREEPVYDDRCSFTVNRWQQTTRLESSGPLTTPTTWPDTGRLRRGVCLGCQREGARHERYTVRLQGAKALYSCDYDEARWRSIVDGAALPLKVGVVTGGADCESLGQK